MRGLPLIATRVSRWITGKDAPAEMRQGGGSNDATFIDDFRKQRAPSQSKLLDEYTDIVYSCSNINATAFSSVPFRLFVQTNRGQSKPKCATRKLSRDQHDWLSSNRNVQPRLQKAVEVEEVLDHPLLDLLNSVNEVIDGFTLFELTDLYQELVGSAYWWVPKNVIGMRDTIWILMSHLVEPVYDKERITTGYKYGTGVNKHVFSAEDVIPFHFPNLKNPYASGWSPAQAVYETINLMGKYRAYEAAMMDNRARPDIIISPKEPIGEAEAERLSKRIHKKFRKGGAGGILVAQDAYGVDVLGMKPKDLQMLATYGIRKVSIANAYGVPMSMLETKNVNRANAEAGHYQHAKIAILPRCRRVEQKLNQQFCPMFDERLFIVFDNPVREDIKTTLMVQRADLKDGVRTINEVRTEKGLSIVEWGDKPWAPSTLIQLGDAPPQPDSSPQSSDAGKDNGKKPKEDDGDENEKARPSQIYEILAASCCGELSNKLAGQLLMKMGVDGTVVLDWLEPLPLDTDKELKRFKPSARASTLEKKLKVWFNQQRRSVLSSLKSIVKAPNLTKPIDLTQWDKRMAADLRPVIMLEYEQGGKELLIRLGVTNTENIWNVSLPETKKAIDKATLKFCNETNKTTSMDIDKALSKLRSDLAEGIVSGENTPAELTRRVSHIFDKAETYRAKRIAITESSRAVHDGQMMSAVESEVVEGFDWLASSDACEICLAIAAESKRHPVKLGDNFESVGGPYSSIQHPPAHPNCQCTVTERLVDNAKEILSDKEKGTNE